MKIEIKVDNKVIELSEETVKSIKAQLEPVLTSELYFEPKIGEDYFHIFKTSLDEGENTMDGIDGKRFELGVFRTTELAQKELDKRLAITRIRKYIVNEGLEFKGDVMDESLYKHIVYYDLHKKCFRRSYYMLTLYQSHFGYLKSEEASEQLIANCEEDLKLVFGIK